MTSDWTTSRSLYRGYPRYQLNSCFIEFSTACLDIEARSPNILCKIYNSPVPYNVYIYIHVLIMMFKPEIHFVKTDFTHTTTLERRRYYAELAGR